MIDSLRLNRQLGETANMIAIGLKAGYDLPLIITNLATQLPEPSQSVMAQIAAKMASGHPASQAFQDVAQIISSDALMKISAALATTIPAHALESAAAELIGQWGRDEAVDAASRILRQAVHAPEIS